MANEVTTRPQVAQQHTFSDLERMAKAVSGSGLFGGIKTEQQALSLMLLAQAEGLHPAIAARDYHIIEGKPSLKADTMLARFLTAGGTVEWHSNTDKLADATFTAPGSEPLRMQWTHEMAQTAKLLTKDVWVKYERAMLRSRLTSEAIRTVMPQIIAGIYTPEELRDEPELRDISPAGQKAPESRRAEEVTDAELVDKETGEIKTAAPAPATETPPAEPQMDEKAFHDHLSAIEAASTLDDLKTAHSKAYAAAHQAGDGKALLRFEVAKNKRKYELTKGKGGAA